MKRHIHATVDRGDALIGIYWYTDDNRVIGLSEPVDDGIIDGDYLQYSGSNHMQAWRLVVRENFPYGVADRIISKGFKSLYRGRCIYSTMTQIYVVTCSKYLKDDVEFRTKIKDYFQLGSVRVNFVALDHYANKLELTGNKAIDALYFDT